MRCTDEAVYDYRKRGDRKKEGRSVAPLCFPHEGRNSYSENKVRGKSERTTERQIDKESVGEDRQKVWKEP